MQDYIRIVCLTANVSSFEEKPELLRDWIKEVAKEIGEQKPNIALIHVQGLPLPQETRTGGEVFSPGKLYTSLVDHPDIERHFRGSRGFFETEPGSEYTGLGSIYLFQDPRSVEIWNGSNNTFTPLQQGHEFFDRISRNQSVSRLAFPDKLNPSKPSGGLSSIFSGNKGPKEKPQHNGFMATKWRILGRPFTFVNLALHSNPSVGFRDMGQKMSEGALVRRDQIQFMIQRLGQENDSLENRIFAGLFNAELDQESLIHDLTKHMSAGQMDKVGPNGEVTSAEFYDFKGKPLLTLSDDQFDLHSSHDWYFGMCKGQMIKKFNNEITKDTFSGIGSELHEPPIYFSPSAHYMYDKREDRDSFMRNRCPQWSDRIFMNDQAWDLAKYDSFSSSGLYYGIVGPNVFLGEHKPVALHATLCVKPPRYGGGVTVGGGLLAPSGPGTRTTMV